MKSTLTFCLLIKMAFLIGNDGTIKNKWHLVFPQTHPSHSLFRCLQDYTQWHPCLWTTDFSMFARATIINRTNVAGWMNNPEGDPDATTILGCCHTHPSGNMGSFMSTWWLWRQWPSQHPRLWKNTCLCLFSIPERERKHNSLKNVFIYSLNYFSQIESQLGFQ